MFKFLLLATLVPLTIQQLTSSCTSCNSNSNSNYAHRFARSVPGYLGNYQGDAYTSNSRRQETLQLNQASNLKFSKLFPLRENVNEDEPIIIEFVEEDDLEKNSEGSKQHQSQDLNQKQKPQYDYVAFNIHPNGDILHQQGDMKYESEATRAMIEALKKNDPGFHRNNQHFQMDFVPHRFIK